MDRRLLMKAALAAPVALALPKLAEAKPKWVATANTARNWGFLIMYDPSKKRIAIRSRLYTNETRRELVAKATWNCDGANLKDYDFLSDPKNVSDEDLKGLATKKGSVTFLGKQYHPERGCYSVYRFTREQKSG